MGLKKSFDRAPGSVQSTDNGMFGFAEDGTFLIAKNIKYRVPKKGQELLPPLGFDINIGRLCLDVVIREPLHQPEGEEVDGKTAPEMLTRIASGFTLTIKPKV
jgi:hypothetical protein